MKESGFNSPKYIMYLLGAILMASALSFIQSAYAQKQKEKEVYTRPEPTKPLKPTVPSANRYQPDKVFLESADSLYRPFGEAEEFEIVKGGVKFRQGAMWMLCDSAWYYPANNSMDAYGHVEMHQGDTLFVYADKLYFDGITKHATLTSGPSRSNVQLKNRTVTLTTDSLDYDLNQQLGWYTEGGVLHDNVNTLSSQYGQYSPRTKEALFRYDVVLTNNKDGYKLYTEELEYNTRTHIAQITQSTRIEGKTDTIITSRGSYNTRTGNAELLSRSTILHRDSAANVTTLEGDSIIYDKAARISRAYMFRTSTKNPAPMVITDTARKVILIGGYGEYNDFTREAKSSDYPLLIEYSRPDSLFLRADTVMSKVITEGLDSVTGKPKEYHLAKAIGMARFFNQDLQGIADTISFRDKDSMLNLIRRPIVWSGNRQIYGNRIDVHFNDSVPDWAELPDHGIMAEHVEDDFYNQITGSKMKALFEDQHLRHLDVEGNVKVIFLPQENDSTYNKLVDAEGSFLSVDMNPDENKIKHLKLWPDVSGEVVPLFDVKRSQMSLPGFEWYEKLRPIRSWYGDRWHWVDELGDVPDALTDHFMNMAPLIGTGSDLAPRRDSSPSRGRGDSSAPAKIQTRQ